MAKTINQTAKEIAQSFFYLTKRRATPATFTMTIGQAKTLLNAGFSKFEIIQGIEYCIKHPPKNGFNSLGWLSYVLEDVLKKIKVQGIKEELFKTNVCDTTQEVDANANKRKAERKGSDNESRFGASCDSKLFE